MCHSATCVWSDAHDKCVVVEIFFFHFSTLLTCFAHHKKTKTSFNNVLLHSHFAQFNLGRRAMCYLYVT